MPDITPTPTQAAPVDYAARRDDEAVEGALRYFVEHAESRDDTPEWRHIEVLLRQLDRLRTKLDNI